MNNKRIRIILIIALCICLSIMVFGVYMLFFGDNTNEVDSLEQNTPMTVVRTVGDVTVRQGVIDGISVLEYANSEENEKPMLILLHGLQGDKWTFEAMAMELAQQGILVLCPDAYGHGERVGEPALTSLEMAAQTGQDIETLLQFYKNSSRVDTSNLGLGGLSMGGFASYYHVANGETTPKTVYTIGATPYWEDMIGNPVTYITLEHGQHGDALSEDEKNTVNRFLHEQSPYNSLLEMDGVDYNIVCGSADEVVPYQGAERFALEMNERYPGSVNFELIEGMPHELTEEEYIKMRDYFADYFA